jgi:superfamily II DNA/RNA helicase
MQKTFFKDFHLDQSILKAIESKGYITPTLIQQKAIPVILSGRDIIASAETGTGKTASFMLPILNKLLSDMNKAGSTNLKSSQDSSGSDNSGSQLNSNNVKISHIHSANGPSIDNNEKVSQLYSRDNRGTHVGNNNEKIPHLYSRDNMGKHVGGNNEKTSHAYSRNGNRFPVRSHDKRMAKNYPKILILVPTRELALQVDQFAKLYGKFANTIKTVSVFGGVKYYAQEEKLARPFDILAATPGRLIDFVKQGKINLSNIEVVVLDEADRMLDMGFIEDVEFIVNKTPATRQTLLFSATIDGSIKKLASRMLKDPFEINIKPEVQQVNIEQSVICLKDLSQKKKILKQILRDTSVKQTIIFTATKHQVDHLTKNLQNSGFMAAGIHGDMKQFRRNKTLLELKQGRFRILVATDVASRGIDVPHLSHIINFDFPKTSEDYVHRIGRTGRAGAEGKAISFIADNDQFALRKLEKYLGHKINRAKIDLNSI